MSAQKALQTVAAGQQSENLLDFDDAPAVAAPQGLAATQILPATSQAAAQNLLSGTSSNPLDDLVSIFGGSGPAAPAGGVPPASDSFGGLDFGAGALSPGAPQPQHAMTAGLGTSASGVGSTNANANQEPQEDLLGLF